MLISPWIVWYLGLGRCTIVHHWWHSIIRQ